MVDDFIRALELIGVSLQDGRSRVLRAIFRAQPATGTQVHFEEMYEQLQEEEGGKEMAKPLVYRYLKSLEEDGLIKVNRDTYRHSYTVGPEVLAQGFEQHLQRERSRLEKDLKDLRLQGERVSSLDATEVAKGLVETLVGKQSKPVARPAYDSRAIFRLIDQEVYDKAKPGDIVRVSIDWISLSAEEESVRHSKTLDCLRENVEFRVLTRVPEHSDSEIKQMRESEYSSAREKLPVRFRFIDKPYRGYQIVARNREGIVMVLSESPATAVWIPRETSPIMVDDAIASFDVDFDAAIDILEEFSKEGSQNGS